MIGRVILKVILDMVVLVESRVGDLILLLIKV